jgi:hypothetical protein
MIERGRMTELGLEGARQIGLVGESAPLGHLPHREFSRRRQLEILKNSLTEASRRREFPTGGLAKANKPTSPRRINVRRPDPA